MKEEKERSNGRRERKKQWKKRKIETKERRER